MSVTAGMGMIPHHAVGNGFDAGRKRLQPLGRELVLLHVLPEPPVPAVAPRVRHAVGVHRHRVVVPARQLPHRKQVSIQMMRDWRLLTSCACAHNMQHIDCVPMNACGALVCTVKAPLRRAVPV